MTSYNTLASGTPFTTSSMVGSDSVSGVTQSATGVRPTAIAQAGSYPVLPSAAVMGLGLPGNYSFSYVGATNTVNKAPLVVAAQANIKVFDGNVSSASLPLVTGLLGTDTVLDLSQIYTRASVGSNKTLTVQSYRISDGSGGANYQVALMQNDRGLINAIPVAVLPPFIVSGPSVSAAIPSPPPPGRVMGGTAVAGGTGVTGTGAAGGTGAGTTGTGTGTMGTGTPGTGTTGTALAGTGAGGTGVAGAGTSGTGSNR